MTSLDLLLCVNSYILQSIKIHIQKYIFNNHRSILYHFCDDVFHVQLSYRLYVYASHSSPDKGHVLPLSS